MIATATAPSAGAGAANDVNVTVRVERPGNCEAQVDVLIDDDQSAPLPSASTTTTGSQNVDLVARDRDFDITVDVVATNCATSRLKVFLRYTFDNVTDTVARAFTTLHDPEVHLTGRAERGVGPLSIEPQAPPSGDHQIKMRTTANPACEHIAALEVDQGDDTHTQSKTRTGAHSVRLPINVGDHVVGTGAATDDCPENAEIGGALRQIGGDRLGTGFTRLLNGTFSVEGTFHDTD